MGYGTICLIIFGSNYTLGPLILLLMLPLLILLSFWMKECCSLRGGVGWIFAQRVKIGEDCENLLLPLAGYNILISKVMGIPMGAELLHYITTEKRKPFFFKSTFL